jgi:uncharacterized protein
MIRALGLVEPIWERPDGRRELGHDEDVVTLAVAAGRAALEAVPDVVVDRICVVTGQPDQLEGASSAVVAVGIGVTTDTPVAWLIGGAAAGADALLEARPGTMVIGVDPVAPAGAAAAVIADSGARIERGQEVALRIPIRVRRAGDRSARDYADARLERDRVRVPAMAWLHDGDGDNRGTVTVVGVPEREARRFGTAGSVGVLGAAAPMFALAAAATDDGNGGDRDMHVVAFDTAAATRLDVSGLGAISVISHRRPGLSVDLRPRPPRDAADIPISLAAYDRAFDAKVGLVAARCVCGQLSYPPRRVCLQCGREGDVTPEPLPRTGEVYTGVTVHVPVPGMYGPYGLVVTQLTGTDVRVLAHVTDAPVSAVEIGTSGRLVLRRVAIREGVSDYGYGWRPSVVGG